MRSNQVLTAGVLGAVVVLSARPVRAVEHEHHIAAGLGPSVLKVDDKSRLMIGAGAALYYTYGLSDTFNLVAEGSSSIVALDAKLDSPNTPHTRPATVDTLGIGATYVLDVVRWVPYAGLLASGAYLHGGTLDGGTLVGGAQLAAGLDYKFNFQWSAGVAYRQHLFLTKLSTYPSYSQLFFRFEYAWGR